MNWVVDDMNDSVTCKNDDTMLSETDVFRFKDDATPMMQQYLTVKEAHQDCLLFYRMGDFYELFLHDAITAAEALDITLTKRGTLGGQEIAMCGVPWHSHKAYLHRLIKKGFRVAICEQMEDPAEAKKRGYKAVVRREVTRIVTAGTLTEDDLLEAKSANYLAALSEVKGVFSLGWLDMSVGDFYLKELEEKHVLAELERISPNELIISDKILNNIEYNEKIIQWGGRYSIHSKSFFEGKKGQRKLQSFFDVKALDGIGDFSLGEMGVAGALLEYLELTQIDAKPRLSYPQKQQSKSFMTIDAATRKSLEIHGSLSGDSKGSLISCVNRTVSSAGNRLLNAYIGAPLIEPLKINQRLDVVEYFYKETTIADALRGILHGLPDVERITSRLYMGRSSPIDVLAMRDGLARICDAAYILSGLNDASLPEELLKIRGDIGDHTELFNLLRAAIADVAPKRLSDGGMVKEGFDAKLDDFRATQAGAQAVTEELKKEYSEETGITSLKIKQNNVLGMFIDITPQHAEKMTDKFIHRQTLANAVRYTTSELRELENKIVNASAYALQHEVEIFERICARIVEQQDALILSAQALASIDVFLSFAAIAKEANYVRPMVDDSKAFMIKSGRHPVVERLQRDEFISNDTVLENEKRFWLITGPNMAGKSTFLRQNALITILAQVGSFVPASEARIGVVDQIFSRVGAANDLARGRSTFMVEMIESANILNNATDRSLVVLDEVGRGTSTFDGLSIAWAMLEYLHDVVQCRGLFATHYHELTVLEEQMSELACYTMKVKEWKGDVIFMHQVDKGVADRSYGIHVGKLAGLPKKVLTRAEKILQKLESENGGASLNTLPLFEHVASVEVDERESEVELQLESLSVDELTPRQAQEALYNLKALLSS